MNTKHEMYNGGLSETELLVAAWKKKAENAERESHDMRALACKRAAEADEALAMVATAERKHDETLSALRKYGRHINDPECECLSISTEQEIDCTCGFSKAAGFDNEEQNNE